MALSRGLHRGDASRILFDHLVNGLTAITVATGRIVLRSGVRDRSAVPRSTANGLASGAVAAWDASVRR
jgi:hypothetical protein